MITITEERGLTLRNVLANEPQNQEHLTDARICATEDTLGKLAGIVSASSNRSKDRRRVVNCAQWKGRKNGENLFRMGSESWFRKMAAYAKPDTQLYEVCYQLDKTEAGGDT